MVTQQYFQSNLYLGVQRLASENSSRASEFLFWETIAGKSGKLHDKNIILKKEHTKLTQSIGALRFAAERHSEKVGSDVPKLTEILFADLKKMKIAGASGNKNSWCSENQATFCQSANALLLSFFHGSSIRLKMEGNFLHRWG